jgi:hypothetical protein
MTLKRKRIGEKMGGPDKAGKAPRPGKKIAQKGRGLILFTLSDGILRLEEDPDAGTGVLPLFTLCNVFPDVGEKVYLMLHILGFLIVFLIVSITVRVPLLFFADKRLGARRSIVVLAVSLAMLSLYLLALLFGIAHAPRLTEPVV